jgi:ATP-dependent protease ClpP protease subunit
MTHTDGEEESVPEDSQPELAPTPRKPSKTPHFTAMNSARYSRQDLIKEIDDAEKTSLICYVGGDKTQIDHNDTRHFVDLLHNIGPGEPIDLLLNTRGGQVDACEKLIGLLQDNVGEAPLRVIVPEMAKSAGTIIALAAQEIIMSASSELGMIDPQYDFQDGKGNWVSHSVIVYLQTFRQYSGLLSGNARNTLAEQMLMDFDAKVVAKFEGIETRIRTLAERVLKINNSTNYTTIVNELLNSTTWKTHEQPIGAADAKDLGLPVIRLAMSDPRWQRYWTLFCLQRKAIGAKQKLFESSYVSQVLKKSSDDEAT